MSNVKKYILTAVTLGCIAMCAGALIGATNLITKDRIAANQDNSINKGIKEIYGNGASIKEKNPIDSDWQYVIERYVIDESESLIGYAFRTEGSNNYGKIALIIGFTDECVFKGLSIIADEQTYAATLEDNYIDPLNSGDRDVEDVSCGATYGAKLVRDMIKEAKQAATVMKGI